MIKPNTLFLYSLLSIIALLSCGTSRHARIESMDSVQAQKYARDYFYMESVRMNNEGQYDAAMDLVTHSFELDTLSAETCFSLAQYFMSMNDRAVQDKYKTTADRLLLRAVKMEPDNYWYRRLLALNYLRLNETGLAIKEYEEMFRRFPERTDLLITLASLYEQVGDYEKELRVLTRYGELEDVADDLQTQRFVCYMQMNELDSAYWEAKEPAQVIELLMNTTREMLEGARTQLDRMRCRDLLDLVMNFCDVVSIHEPQLVGAYIQKSIGYFWLGQNDDAMKVLDKGLANVREPLDRATLFSTRGDFYQSLGNDKLMYENYDSTLVNNPNEIGVLNNYAYYLSLENRDLERALSMSAITVEMEPSNATYLDTYAWILFRLHRYSDALEYIERAIKYMEVDNPEIFEHYGDVLFKCGQTQKALDNWHRAMQLNSSSPTLDRKIKEMRYVE